MTVNVLLSVSVTFRTHFHGETCCGHTVTDMMNCTSHVFHRIVFFVENLRHELIKVLNSEFYFRTLHVVIHVGMVGPVHGSDLWLTVCPHLPPLGSSRLGSGPQSSDGVSLLFLGQEVQRHLQADGLHVILTESRRHVHVHLQEAT